MLAEKRASHSTPEGAPLPARSRPVLSPADCLTLARLAFLPVPIAMLYRGGASWSVAGFLALVVLGLSDVVDGPLARRLGSTRLGPILEGIADRVFVVVVYLALADLGVISMGVAALLMGRELFVVCLRGIAPGTAVIGAAGRLKMTVQMVGAGFLMVLWLIPHGPWIHVILLAAFAISGARLAASWRANGRAGWQSAWWTGLTGVVAASRGVLTGADTVHVLVTIVVAISVVSALMLAWSVRHEARARMTGHPAVWLRLVLSTLVIPALWTATAPVAVVMIVAAAEFALLGLAAALAGAGAAVNDHVEVARGASLLAAVAMIRWLPAIGEPITWIAIIVMVAILAGRTRELMRVHASTAAHVHTR